MLAYAITGPVGAPVVLLLHPIATTSDIWLPQLGPLSSIYRVVTVDLAGHGKSASVAPPETIEGYAKQVWDLLDRIDVRELAVVGLSFGGMVAQSMALERPGAITAMVLAHTTSKTSDEVSEMWSQRIEHAKRDGMEKHADQTLTRWFTPRFRDESPLSTAWVRAMVARTPVVAYAAAARAIQRLDHLHRLASIRVPVLLVAGEHDVAIPLSVTQAMAAQLQESHLKVIAAAHIGNVEQPTAFTECAGDFLARQFETRMQHPENP